ncbi:MAG: gliding motility lipoprotein GldH [Flavobacteriales bacterium]
MTRNNSLFLLFVGAIMIFSSCKGEDIYFQKYETIQSSSWNKEEVKVFDFDIVDTTKLYEFYLNLRNNNEYGYGNIFVFWTLQSPDGRTKTDTAQFILAKPNGQWLGKSASGTVIENSMYFLKTKLPTRGTYSFEFVQGMRDENLEGIKDVGLKIKKKDEPR